MQNQEQRREQLQLLLKKFEPNRNELAKAMGITRTYLSDSRIHEITFGIEKLIGARKYFLERFNYDIRDNFPDMPEDLPSEANEAVVKYNSNESYRVKYEQSLEREINLMMKKMDVLDAVNQNLIIQNDILTKVLSNMNK